MNKTKHATRGFRVILSVFLAMAVSFSVMPNAAMAANSLDVDISVGDIIIGAGTAADSVKLTYGATGIVSDNLPASTQFIIYRSLPAAQSTKSISVTGSQTYNITLQDVDIDSATVAAFSIGTGSIVNLKVLGANTLKSADDFAGLNVHKDGTLVIDGSGSLTATGGAAGAGIGGGTGAGGGDITIKGGTIDANAGIGAAGIGGGYNGLAADTKISITDSAYIKNAKGGAIDATHAGGAGIGTGGADASAILDPVAGSIIISSGVDLAKVIGGTGTGTNTAGAAIGSGGSDTAASTSYDLHTITFHDNKDPETTQGLTYTINASASDSVLPTLAFVQLHNSAFAPTIFDNYWYQSALGANGHEMGKAFTDSTIGDLFAFGKEPKTGL